MNIKAFKIGNEVTEICINDELNTNIENILMQLVTQEDLKTTWYLDTESENLESNPIHCWIESIDKADFNYITIAEKLKQAEQKSDGSRNMTIREGVLLIKWSEQNLILVKLEKQTVIDIHTFSEKEELSILKDYFKICIYNGDSNDIKLIDKNRITAKYWHDNFLGLKQCTDSELNTESVINLLRNDRLFDERYNTSEIKDFAEKYIIENKIFDKSDLHEKIQETFDIVIELENLFSTESRDIDSVFKINGDIINRTFKKKIQVSKDITIVTKNFAKSIRQRSIVIDRDNMHLVIVIDDQYLNNIIEIEGLM